MHNFFFPCQTALQRTKHMIAKWRNVSGVEVKAAGSFFALCLKCGLALAWWKRIPFHLIKFGRFSWIAARKLLDCSQYLSALIVGCFGNSSKYSIPLRSRTRESFLDVVQIYYRLITFIRFSPSFFLYPGMSRTMYFSSLVTIRLKKQKKNFVFNPLSQNFVTKQRYIFFSINKWGTIKLQYVLRFSQSSIGGWI